MGDRRMNNRCLQCPPAPSPPSVPEAAAEGGGAGSAEEQGTDLGRGWGVGGRRDVGLSAKLPRGAASRLRPQRKGRKGRGREGGRRKRDASGSATEVSEGLGWDPEHGVYGGWAVGRVELGELPHH